MSLELTMISGGVCSGLSLVQRKGLDSDSQLNKILKTPQYLIRMLNELI